MKITISGIGENALLCTVAQGPMIIRDGEKKYAADQLSAAEGNMLVENVETESVIELRGGARLDFDGNCVIAFTGANFDIRRGDESLPLGRAIEIDEGDEVEITDNGLGRYLYISVNGESLCMTDCGEGVKEVVISDCGELLENMENRVIERFEPSSEVVLRLIPGPYSDLYDMRSLDLLYTSEFTVSGNDRGGVRFSGLRLSPPDEAEYPMICPDGLITVDADGMLCAKAGGDIHSSKAKGAAAVISSDMRELVQLTVGTRVRFEPCTLQLARKIAIARRKTYIRNYLRINEY